MKTPNNYWRLLLLSACLLVAGRAAAATFETVQSTYLGDGWFQYDVQMFYDPYFLEADLTQFAVGFTNAVDVENGDSPTNWASTNAASWYYTGSYPQSRPNEQIFLMHSSSTSYRLDTNAWNILNLVTSDVYPNGVVSANMVGYVVVPCLVPCLPADADGSPSNHLETIVLIPDMVIEKLLLGPIFYGLTFDWASDSTDLLQASSDMVHWNNITYILGTAGETTWRTNRHLLDSGQYFRLLLAAGYQTTNVAPLTAASSVTSVKTSATLKSHSTTTSNPRVTGCKPKGDIVSVQVATVPGQSGQVRMLSSVGTILQTQSFNATSKSIVVNFSTKNFTGPVLFQAVTQ